MTHSTPGRALLLTAALAGAAAILSPPGDAHAAARGAAPRCSSSQLVETLSSDRGGGTAGAYFYTLRFSNLGQACTLSGYPGVSAVSTNGRQMGRAASRVTGSQPTVTLRAASPTYAASATATLEFVNTSALSNCHQRLAAGVRVYAPDTSGSKVIPFVVDACSEGSSTFLKVKPVG